MTENKKTALYTYLLPLSILSCFVIALWPKLSEMVQQWSGDDSNYAYLVVPLFLYLCWDMRERFHFKAFSWRFWGTAPVLFALLTMVVGELASVITLQFASVWLCLLGVALSLYGSRARHLAFPLIILAFIIPLPPFINNILTFQLKLAASTLSVQMLRLFGTSVVLTGNIIDLGTTKLQVVDACSGLRYFVPMILTSLLVGHFFTRVWWRRLFLLAIVPPLSIFVNALRIFFTGTLTTWGYTRLADSFFHDFSGLVIFFMTVMLLALLAFLLNRLGPAPVEKGNLDRVDQAADSVGHTKAIWISSLLCALFIFGGWALQALPGISRIPKRTSFAHFPMQIDAWQGQRQFLSQEILDSLWADDYVSAVYEHKDIPNRIQLFIPYYEYQATRHTAHAPQACMLGGGWSMSQSLEREFKTETGRSEKIMTMVWENATARLLGSYFFLQRGRVLTSPWMNKWYLFWDAISKQRTDGALVRVEMVMAPGQTTDEAYAILAKFVGHVWPSLAAFVPE